MVLTIVGILAHQGSTNFSKIRSDYLLDMVNRYNIHKFLGTEKNGEGEFLKHLSTWLKSRAWLHWQTPRGKGHLQHAHAKLERRANYHLIHEPIDVQLESP